MMMNDFTISANACKNVTCAANEICMECCTNGCDDSCRNKSVKLDMNCGKGENPKPKCVCKQSFYRVAQNATCEAKCPSEFHLILFQIHLLHAYHH